ncbi:GPP34 family phosphoprotein [Micromonospora sp. FIMYZ51]|uniref:GOLPH3/VPS74 family protein n=1 Tax=Micromonospora sp. FIMYZ51 TaxID=3051832 RepID=UPI00311E9D1A
MNFPHPGAADDDTRPVPVYPPQVRSSRPVRGVAQTMRLADEFFFLAHDDQSGRPRLFDPAMAHGLAAALLAELCWDGRVTFVGQHLRVTAQSTPRDWLQHLVLDRLAAESRHTATRTWLMFLANTAYEQVATRMWQGGLIAPQHEGRWWWQRTVWVPADTNTAAWSWARLSHALRTGQQLNDFDVTLAGLAVHTHLDSLLLDGASSTTRVFLRRQVERAHPQLRALFADLGSVVDASVLAHRT